jgi:hypothetical protein
MLKTSVIALMLTIAPMFADTLYTYTGNPFTYISGSGGPTTSDYISLSFQLLTPLPPTTGDAEWCSGFLEIANFGIVKSTISDGIYSFSDSSGSILTSGTGCGEVATDSLGNIVFWSFYTIENSASIYTDGAYHLFGAISNDLSTQYPQSLSAPIGWTAENANVPGTWTMTTVSPEPASWLLFSIGLISLNRLRKLLFPVYSSEISSD